jgi:hypothetical protein
MPDHTLKLVSPRFPETSIRIPLFDFYLLIYPLSLKKGKGLIAEGTYILKLEVSI